MTLWRCFALRCTAFASFFFTEGFFTFCFIDTPAYIDNSQSDTDKDDAEELSEEEVVAGFEFETEKVEPEESYLEDVPMFKQKRLEDE